MENGYKFTKSNTVMIEWKINKVSSYLSKKDNKTDIVKSSVFSTGSKIGDQWQLVLILNHEPTRNRFDGKTYINLKNISIGRTTAKGALYISNLKQEKILIVNFETNFNIKGDYASIEVFKNKKLLDNMPEFIPNDILTFYLEITVIDNPVISPDENLCHLSNNHLLTDLENLFVSKDYSDVTITVQDVKFQAHKLILSIRSPVLAAMFTHDMIEKKSNEVFIPDIAPEVFGKVLSYIYTDKVKDLTRFADRVLEAAEKYQIQSLKEICEEELIKSLNRENIIKTLDLADRYNAKNLKDYAIKCIIADAKAVMKMSEFKEFEKSNPTLAWELLRLILLSNMDKQTTMTLTN